MGPPTRACSERASAHWRFGRCACTRKELLPPPLYRQLARTHFIILVNGVCSLEDYSTSHSTCGQQRTHRRFCHSVITLNGAPRMGSCPESGQIRPALIGWTVRPGILHRGTIQPGHIEIRDNSPGIGNISPPHRACEMGLDRVQLRRGKKTESTRTALGLKVEPDSTHSGRRPQLQALRWPVGNCLESRSDPVSPS